MSIKIVPAQFHTPKNVHTGKWYAKVMSIGTVTTEQLAEELSHRSTVTQADILSVLIALSYAIRRHLLQSETVHLVGLGQLKVSVRSHMVETQEQVSDKLIYNYRVLLHPDKTFTQTGEGPHGGRSGYYTKKLTEGIKFALK